jgi:type I restriction enzyme S subunit
MAVESWTEVELGDLLDVKHGFAFKGEHFREEPPGDILLTPGNFAIGGGFKRDKFKYYNGPVPDDYVLSEGDLLVTMTDLSKAADTLGYPALVPAHSSQGPRFLHNQRLGLVNIKKNDRLRKRFLYYLMCTRDYRHEILAGATGTTVKHTSPTKIKRFRGRIPSIAEQDVIADILGSLDDKIEMNGRMNRALEGMARATFNAWFIDFEPVKAKAAGSAEFAGMSQEVFEHLPSKFEETEIGLVPAGWDVVPLDELFAVNPRRTLRTGEVAPYLAMADMPTQGHAPDHWEERPFGSGMRFQNGDTLVARITPCLENGKTAFVDFLPPDTIGWGSTEYIVLRPNPPLPPLYAYCLARSVGFRDFAVSNMTGTSGRQRVPTASFAHYSVPRPSPDVAAAFGEYAALAFQTIAANQRESRVLRRLRDVLLPKLMSGDLRVSAGSTEP